MGVPSIAVSLAQSEMVDYTEPAGLIREWIGQEEFLQNCRASLLNINFPGSHQEDWKGMKITKLGKTIYDNKFECQESAFGPVYYWTSGSIISQDDPDTDLMAIKDGYVSITPLHSDLTDDEQIKVLSEWSRRERSNE